MHDAMNEMDAPGPEPDHITTTRTVYDRSVDLYVEVIGTIVNTRIESQFDLDVLDRFARDVLASGGGRVLDVGCGPGRVAAYLADRGVDVGGVDISTEMVAAARRAHPNLSFGVGRTTDLPVEDASLSAAVLWYSVIHTPPTDLDEAWTELRRVLMSDARALLAFQSGSNERVERRNAYDTAATLTLYRHSVDDVVESLRRSGFVVLSQSTREPELGHESTAQSFIVVQRTPGGR